MEISEEGLTLKMLKESKHDLEGDLDKVDQLNPKYLIMVSSTSFRFDEIKSFMFGGFNSRFWGLRKHINSLNELQI